jgi:hypothetical protein
MKLRDMIHVQVSVKLDEDNCLRLLRAAYENGFQADHADDVADLRHAIQKLILDLDARILSQPTPRLLTDPKSIRKRAYLHHRVYYAGPAAFRHRPLWMESRSGTLSICG